VKRVLELWLIVDYVLGLGCGSWGPRGTCWQRNRLGFPLYRLLRGAWSWLFLVELLNRCFTDDGMLDLVVEEVLDYDGGVNWKVGYIY